MPLSPRAVTRALNGENVPDPEIGWVDVQIGDRFLVCSDGLTDLVDNVEIATALARPSAERASDGVPLRDGERSDLDGIVDQLVDDALRAGGRDNVTCILGEVTDGPPIRPFGRALGAFFPTNLIDGAAIRMVRSGGRRGVRLESVSAQ